MTLGGDCCQAGAIARYRDVAAPAVEAAAGRYLARGGTTEVLQGDRVPNRIVLLELPDLAAARAWYESPAYVDARALRADAATGSIIAVEGSRRSESVDFRTLRSGS